MIYHTNGYQKKVGLGTLWNKVDFGAKKMTRDRVGNYIVSQSTKKAKQS